MSIFKYEAHHPDNTLDISSVKSPITLQEPFPLLGHRFGRLRVWGVLTSENYRFACSFLETAAGTMTIGAVDIMQGPLKLAIAPEFIGDSRYLKSMQVDITMHGRAQLGVAIAAIKAYWSHS